MTIALSGKYTVAQSQIVPDSTLGASRSVVTPSVVINGLPSDRIDGGVRRGVNLFHSFREFNVGSGQGAYFTVPAGIQNIFSRVSGSNPSNIFGKLGVLGNANLFLINPNGITFGPSSSLDVGGSFVASTASSIRFSDGTNFSAKEPGATPLLTVSVPIGLQFGENPGSIINQSLATDSYGNFVGLQVQPGNTLALVGGDVLLDDSNITTESGRIELGSVDGPSLVSLTSTASGWALGYSAVQNFRDIQLTKFAVVYTYPAKGEGGSDIQVQGRRVTLSDGSFIADVTGESRKAGNLTVNAKESVELIGSAPAADGVQSPSSLRTDTLESGPAGDLRITTGSLIVRSGARISVGTTTGSTGQGGTLAVTADSVELSGTSVDGRLASGLFAQTGGTGPAGNLAITTGQLDVRDKAQVSVSSVGSGDAGDIKLTARSIRLDNLGKLTATTESGKGGGNIIIQTLDLLQLRRNSNISTNALGNGNGGDITISTGTLTALENSDISANAQGGVGGRVSINAQGIFRSPDSDITAIGKSPQFNGIVQINTPDVDPSRGVLKVPTAPVNITGLIAQGCPANVESRASKFVVTGRGGLPPSPYDALTSDTVWEDARLPIATMNQQRRALPRPLEASHPPHAKPPSGAAVVPVVPATGWVFNNLGLVTLTALAPNAPASLGANRLPCHAPQQ